MSRQFSYKKLLNHTDVFGIRSFSIPMNRDNGGNSIDLILVGKCPLSLSDYRKEEIIPSMTSQ